jgi:hypothetical protein
MALNFLCPVHRDWVYFHPQEALSHLEGAQQQGEMLMQRQDWHEAIKFLGCAFETTEILMELQGGQKSFLLSRLTSLAVLLATSFEKLNVNNHKQLILEQAQQKLIAASDDSFGNEPRQAYIQQCLSVIKSNLEQAVFIHPFARSMASELMH